VDKFWELFQESVIVQACLALVLLITICYMYATGQEVPDALMNAFMVILGYYFGSKVQQKLAKK